MRKNENGKVSTVMLVFIIVLLAIALVIVYYLGFVKKDDKNLNSNIVENNQEYINDNQELENNNQSDINEVENNENIVNVNDSIILYSGYEIDKKMGIQSLSDMKKTDENESKYNIKYYNYENGRKLGVTTGKFGIEIHEGYSIVDNVKKIAISEDYNAIPRTLSRIEKLPEELNEFMDCSSVDIDSIDLDGDGNKEYILCYTVNYSEGQIGDGEPEASSSIILFDSNYKKISDLVSLENGFWANMKEEEYKIFLSLDDVEYIDIDNDGIMEIIIDIPTYEGPEISILKYNEGKIIGEVNYKASVQP